MIMEIELQSQVLDAMNHVLYDQLKFKGNRMDYYNALNLYMHPAFLGTSFWGLVEAQSTASCVLLPTRAEFMSAPLWGQRAAQESRSLG